MVGNFTHHFSIRSKFLDYNKIISEYQSILQERPNIEFNVTYKEPEKLLYGQFAYKVKVNSVSKANLWHILQSQNKLHRVETQAEQKFILQKIISMCPKKQKIKIDLEITLPKTEEKLKKLKELNDKSGQFRKTFVDAPYKDAKYSTKVVVQVSSDWNKTRAEQLKEFIDNFERLYTILGDEAESDTHKFTNQIINHYKSCVREYDRIMSNPPSSQPSRFNWHFYSNCSFTLWLKDESDLDMICLFFNKNFNVSKVTVMSGSK
jgi:hypothetical protein